jgi:hypothetical protein
VRRAGGENSGRNTGEPRRRIEPVSLDQRLGDGRPRHETIAANEPGANEPDAGAPLEDRDAIESAARETVDKICSLELVTPQQKLIIGARLALMVLVRSHHTTPSRGCSSGMT